LNCNKDQEPIPALYEKYQADLNQAVDKWCEGHNIDREATERAMRERYGPQTQHLTVVRDEQEVEEAFQALKVEEVQIAHGRGFTDWQIKNWLRYGVCPGQPDLKPLEPGERYVGPDDWIGTGVPRRAGTGSVGTESSPTA
jgi:hypothetical protein